MNESTIKQLQSTLLQHRTSLISRVQRLDQALDETGNPDWGEMAAARELSEVNQALETQERKELEAVQDALSRIDSGTYGDCSGCGSSISDSRLQAVPWAALCIRCKEATEAPQSVAQ